MANVRSLTSSSPSLADSHLVLQLDAFRLLQLRAFASLPHLSARKDFELACRPASLSTLVFNPQLQ